MIQIDKTIVSFDVFNKAFVCDLDVCKGACCVHGDAGAPLETEEVDILNKIYPKVKKHMTDEGISVVESQGVSMIDKDGDLVTTLVNNSECVFTYKNDAGVVLCAIRITSYNVCYTKLLRVPVEELATFEECGECGTAAVITPIALINDPANNTEYTYCTDGIAGPVCTKLYKKLTASYNFV